MSLIACKLTPFPVNASGNFHPQGAEPDQRSSEKMRVLAIRYLPGYSFRTETLHGTGLPISTTLTSTD